MTAHDVPPGAVPDPMVHRRETRHVVRRRLDVHREPLTPCFGLRITGVDLTALDAGQEQAIIDAGNRAGVVHIPGQNLSEREQLDFTALFGPIRVLRVNKARRSKAQAGVVEISNVDAAGRVVLPQPLRKRFHLTPGSLLEVDVEPDGIRLRPQTPAPSLSEVDGLLLHEGEPTGDLLHAVDEAKSLRDEQVNSALG